MATKQAPVIVWFRRDLRIDDNAALSAAAQTGRPILPLYILEPAEAGTGPLGAAQRWWLHHSLAALAGRLADLGAPLTLRSGPADVVLDALIAETGTDTIHWNRRHDPPGMTIDRAIKATLKARGLTATSFAGQLLHDPTRLLTGEKKPFRVYTPFWKALERSGEPHEAIEPPAGLIALPEAVASEHLDDWHLTPEKPDWATPFREIWTPGEAAARAHLETFVDGAIDGYGADRDRPALDATSMLSPHLALGEISPARIWHATRGLDAPTGDLVHFRKELAWREFCYHLHFHFPALPEKNWNDKFDAFPWQEREEAFMLWTRGLTGYPIVDAGMRQLWQTGFMHNRVRMIVASFLIKHLMIDWREGERWFWDTLVDADAAANAQNWQWVAGSGADASPFFRIFNPTGQGEKFDPNGTYVRRWVPELAELPADWIHKPWAAPPGVLALAGVKLGQTYPAPIVDHARARDRALDALKATRD